VLGKLERHHLRQQPQAALGGTVGGRSSKRNMLVDRRDVDDPPSVAGGDHPPGRLLGDQERAGQVDVDHPLPLLQRQVDEIGGVARAGVVDQHVEPAERVGELSRSRGRGRERQQVEPADLGPAAVRLDLGRGLARSLLVLVPGDPDVEATAGERNRGGLADAGVRAGHDRAAHRGGSATRLQSMGTVRDSADGLGARAAGRRARARRSQRPGRW
jgi:hypothetical protein